MFSTVTVLSATFVLLDDKKDVVVFAIEETHVRLRVPPFSTNEEGNAFASAGDSLTSRVAQGGKQRDGEVSDRGLVDWVDYRHHCKLNEVYELSVAIGLHVVRPRPRQHLLVNRGRRQVVDSEEGGGILELYLDVVRCEVVYCPVATRLCRADEIGHGKDG